MKIPAVILPLFFPLLLLAQPKVLIVASNVEKVNGKINGTYLMEIAIPFDYFIQHNVAVDIVSPKGGKAAIYHKGDTVQVLKNIVSNPLFINKTSNTIIPSDIKPKEYSAIIYPGGYGHFWDVYSDKKIAEIAATIYESGGVIGALGHGTADLLNIKLQSNEYLVKGKTVTCFPTWCEKEFMAEADYGKLLPVDMENELIKRGANVKVCNKENRKEGINIFMADTENRIVTAAFADGGSFVAEEIYKLLLMKDK